MGAQFFCIKGRPCRERISRRARIRLGRCQYSNRDGTVVSLRVYNDLHTVRELFISGSFRHQASRIAVESNQGCGEVGRKRLRVVEAFVRVGRSDAENSASQFGSACLKQGNRLVISLVQEGGIPGRHESCASVLIWKGGVYEHHSENLPRVSVSKEQGLVTTHRMSYQNIRSIDFRSLKRFL